MKRSTAFISLTAIVSNQGAHCHISIASGTDGQTDKGGKNNDSEPAGTGSMTDTGRAEDETL